MAETSIGISNKTKDRLNSLGIKASYDKIINMILNERLKK